MPIATRAVRITALACLLTARAAHAGLGTAVEFYNASINHYFVTAYPEEAAALDAGTNVRGWVRTGGQFTVFTDNADGLAAVCRFFGTPNVGPNSHFYTADPAECAKVKTLPAWTYEGIAFYIPLPTSGQCGGNWPVYRSYYSDNISDANHRFTVDLTAHVRMKDRRGDILEGIVMCAPVSDEEREADVVRFLEQATLGPTEALVQEVKAKGIEKWLDEQLAMNVTRITQYPDFNPAPGVACIDDTSPPIDPEKYCLTYKVSSTPVAWEFYRQSVTAPDQLRLRMAHVWHQILVLGPLSDTYAIADFQQRLRDRVFGSFEDILVKFALSPQMGFFQNWVFNVPEHDGIKPNENFARELMQLFTIGVNALNEDGTPKSDAGGRLIPAYEQRDVSEMARVLTGYSFPTRPGDIPGFITAQYFFGDMQPFESYHDQGAKSLLGGTVQIPGNNGAANDVRRALRALVDHANTPPFLSKQLIQKTVTSNPSPGYVGRVAAAFKNNGSGVRGDLAAVTRAILLDPEARGARKIDPEYGRLREPVLFWTAMMRALDMSTDGYAPHARASYSSGQMLFVAPTVFNYYPADGTLLGTSLPAPEFGLFSTSEALNRANAVSGVLYHADGGWDPQAFVKNATGTSTPSLAAFLADAGDVDALVERMNRLFLHGTMRPEMRQTMRKALQQVDAANALRRAQLAVNLVLVSVDYQVQK